MANQVVCPRCMRANEASSAYCIGCGYRLASESREDQESRPDDDDREQREIRAEMTSVWNELAEAVALLERLRSRVVELERRTQRPVVPPQRPMGAEAASDTAPSSAPSDPISGDVISGRRRPAAPDQAAGVESRRAQSVSSPQPARDVERASRNRRNRRRAGGSRNLYAPRSRNGRNGCG